MKVFTIRNLSRSGASGFEELKARAQEYGPDRVEKITWVPKEKIREAARLYASRKPACMMHTVGIEQNADTISTCLTTVMLPALTGNLDIPGGNLYPMFQGHARQGRPELYSKTLDHYGTGEEDSGGGAVSPSCRAMSACFIRPLIMARCGKRC